MAESKNSVLADDSECVQRNRLKKMDDRIAALEKRVVTLEKANASMKKSN